jgi:tellurite resistance protein TehA-like permease
VVLPTSSALVCFRERLQYACAAADYVFQVPYESDWLYYIGLVFFFFNLCLFVTNCILITVRFRLVPGSFVQSFLDQTESLFIPAVVSPL